MSSKKLWGSCLAVLLFVPLVAFQNCADGFQNQGAEIPATAGIETEILKDAPRGSLAAASAPYRWTDASILFSTYAGYSPSTIAADKVWFGGWISANDPGDYLRAIDAGAAPQSIFGPDKIFVAKRNGSAAQISRVFALKGYHVNDPSVVTPPSTASVDRSKWLYMYFTMLDNRLAESCRKRGGSILDCRDLFEGHDVGMASSVDGGLTWTHRGIAVPARDSADRRGAWMPSVVPQGQELALYYSTGSNDYSGPNLYRQRLAADGFTRIGSPQKISIAGFKAGQLYANIDVKTATIEGKRIYLMVANSGNQKEIHAFLSKDGVAFRPVANSPWLRAETDADTLLTPHLYLWGENDVSPPTSAGTASNSDALAFVFLDFVHKGRSSSYEPRRHDGISFRVPADLLR